MSDQLVEQDVTPTLLSGSWAKSASAASGDKLQSRREDRIAGRVWGGEGSVLRFGECNELDQPCQQLLTVLLPGVEQTALLGLACRGAQRQRTNLF